MLGGQNACIQKAVEPGVVASQRHLRTPLPEVSSAGSAVAALRKANGIVGRAFFIGFSPEEARELLRGVVGEHSRDDKENGPHEREDAAEQQQPP